MNTKRILYTSLIRKKAEKQLTLQPPISDLKLSEIDVLKLYHELEVYKIELEMQLEELIISHKREKNWRNDFFDTKNELLISKGLKDKKNLELIKVTHNISKLMDHNGNRELKIMDLKNEINELLKINGSEVKY